MKRRVVEKWFSRDQPSARVACASGTTQMPAAIALLMMALLFSTVAEEMSFRLCHGGADSRLGTELVAKALSYGVRSVTIQVHGRTREKVPGLDGRHRTYRWDNSDAKATPLSQRLPARGRNIATNFQTPPTIRRDYFLARSCLEKHPESRHASVVGMVDATGDLSSSSDQSDPLSRAPLVEVLDILEDGGCANFDATTACSSVGGGGSTVGGDSTVSSAPSTASTFQPSISAAPTVEASDPPSPSPTAMSQEMIDLLAAKAKWGQPARYEYVFYKSCHCMSEFVQPMHVIVKDGTKINVTYVEDAISGSESQDVINSVYTIEKQFMVIEQALSGPFKADSVVVDYDDELGYPLVLSIDYESAIADEEFQIFNSVQQQVRF